MLALRSNRGTPFGVRAAPSKLPVSSVGLHGLRPCVRYKLQPPATNRKGRDGVPVTDAAQAKERHLSGPNVWDLWPFPWPCSSSGCWPFTHCAGASRRDQVTLTSGLAAFVLAQHPVFRRSQAAVKRSKAAA
ncbi:hypothetical protein WJX75_004153 [Coccomyxa subellipsoidea]|uniref:Uncharacterized protein n=1 Tax=Coccomyxa subellipsoidea TaxID=248742 RepID=A0ABR2YLC7_9CHLO